MQLDKKNGNTLWDDAISKDMKNVRVAFNILLDGEAVPSEQQKVRCHMVPEINMDDLRGKERLAAEGKMTDAPLEINYASVVSVRQ